MELVLDEVMSSDIRFGIRVRTEIQKEAGSRAYRRKDGTGTPMSFCEWLIDDAGGFRRFFEDYELVPERG